MFDKDETKNYKFKLDGVAITADIDGSFTDFSFSTAPDIVSYIEYRHYHVAYELFLIEEEPTTILSDSISEEYRNCILIIPPKYDHLSFRKKDYRMLFSFSSEKNKKSGFADFLRELEASSAPTKLIIDEKITTYMHELSRLLSSYDPISEEITATLLKLIFYKMYTLNAHRPENKPLSKNESYILQIDNIINSFEKHIDLGTVASALHLSKKQASRIIAKAYNKPLSQLLTEKRLDAASLLLLHTDKTVSEIVEEVGFPSESYFYSTFKKAYGCTPNKYKNRT